MARANNGAGPGVDAWAELIRRINRELVDEPAITYRECRRNHAAPMGRFTVDGCCEFLKSGEDGTPEALICAACGCHRCFHRRDLPYHRLAFITHLLHHAVIAPPPPLPQRLIIPFVNAGVVAPVNQEPNAVGHGSENLGGGEIEDEMERKKPRTKLTEEQKARMTAFAERLGWRAQKHDEEEILNFCSDVGISRLGFRVWLSNKRRRGEAAPSAPRTNI